MRPSARRAVIVCVSALALAGLAAGCATMNQPSQRSSARYDDRARLGDAAYFYDALSPYGRWVDLDPYGPCWLPDGLGPGWSPYSDGFWTYSDYGWTWVDQEKWGWAPFHYGRWWLDPQYGWVWIPGTEWAPAWVAWREGDAYVAWAPLPPTVHWSVDVPLTGGGGSVAALPDAWWNVARPSDLADAGLRNRLVPASDKGAALSRTADRTRITSRGNTPFNEGVSVDRVESRIGRSLPRYRVVDAPPASAPRGGDVTGGSVSFFRPALGARSQRGVSRPPARERPPAAGVAPAPAASASPAAPAPATPLARAFTPPAARAPSASAADSTRLEAFLDSEHKRLAREQEAERKQAAGDSTQTAVLVQRHALEQQAFGTWAQRQRAGVHAGGVLKLKGFDRRAVGAAKRGKLDALPALRDTTRGAR